MAIISPSQIVQIKCKPGVRIRDALDKAMRMRGLTPEICIIFDDSR